LVEKYRSGRIYLYQYSQEDKEGKGGQLTIREDPRITRVGRWLRRNKLDELPQLFNILKGDMSFVGPRPEVPQYVEFFEKGYKVLLTIKPGLTDLASLRYMNESVDLESFDRPEEGYQRLILPEKIRLSTIYVGRNSFLFDLLILLETVLRLIGVKTSLIKLEDSSPLGSVSKNRRILTLPWHHFSRSYWSALRILFDSGCVGVSLGLAFLSHFIFIQNFMPQVTVGGTAGFVHLEKFFMYVVPIMVVAVLSLVILRVYDGRVRPGQSWQPRRLFLAISVPPIVCALLVYFLPLPTPPFSPFSMSLLTWIFLVVFLGVPRAIKYFIMTQMVIDIHHRHRKHIKSVLVIGGSGYIGSQLCRDLLKEGYKVRILDSFLFGEFPINEIVHHKSFDVINGDFRNVQSVFTAMRGMDAVVHLGGLVGDPACSIDDDLTVDINLSATMMLAELCKSLGIERFIFASSCSVYGLSGQSLLTEDSPLNPVSLYARTKIASERILLNAVGENFSPTILRFSTLFGLSPRPRFDLVVNLLAAQAAKNGKIEIHGGSQWRPFVHVRDVSKTVLAVLQATREKVGGEIFNVGTDKNNFRLGDVGEMVLDAVPKTQLVMNDDIQDARDYNVSFEKLSQKLGLELSVSVAEGIREIRDAVVDGTIKDFTASQYSNLKTTQKILNDFVQTANGSESEMDSLKPLGRQTGKSFLRHIEDSSLMTTDFP